MSPEGARRNSHREHSKASTTKAIRDADVADNPVVGNAVACPHEECEFQARRFPGKKPHHHRFAWTGGRDDIHAALRKANVIDEAGAPTRFVNEARTSYPMDDGDIG